MWIARNDMVTRMRHLKCFQYKLSASDSARVASEFVYVVSKQVIHTAEAKINKAHRGKTTVWLASVLN